MADEGLGGVPDAYRQGAEEVREHLVSLRGGAPFLSPSDAIQLVQWFDSGVSVGDILRALERAHLARRKSPSRIPLGLRQAKRHLGKPTAGLLRKVVVEARPEDGPLAPLVAVVRARAADDPHRADLEDLADQLAGLREADPDALVRSALALVRDFRELVWDRAAPDRKQAARRAAEEELADLLPVVDEATATALLDEEARERIRAPYAWLDAASIWDVVEAL